MSDKFSEAVAKICLEKFSSLPRNGKPVKDKHWTVMAAIVKEDKRKLIETMEVISLATGTSCVGVSQMQQDGKILHDCHAEVLAQRGFKRYLLHQVSLLMQKHNDCIFEHDTANKIKLKPFISFHFYASQTPCGDASIFPQLHSVDNGKIAKNENPNPSLNHHKREPCTFADYSPVKKLKVEDENCLLDLHRTGAKPSPYGKQDQLKNGLCYHERGLLRVKPGRGVRTCSMSCSDKMLKWNIMGCQGKIMMALLSEPIYLCSITFGKCLTCKDALERALYNRIPRNETDKVLKGSFFNFYKPKIYFSNVQFQFYKPEDYGTDLKPCGSAIVWCDVPIKNLQVVCKGGYLLGTTEKTRGSPKSICSVSRYSLAKAFKQTALEILCKEGIALSQFNTITYCQLKDMAKEYSTTWTKVTHSVLKSWLCHSNSLDQFVV